MGQFVFICNFIQPGKAHSKGQRTLASIGRHIDYIATRPGVALNEETKQMAEIQFQTSDIKSESQELEELAAELEPGAEPEKEKDLEKYVQYMHERPKSHGLFGPDEDKIPDLQETKQTLLNHKGLVWTSILSLTEEDAVKLGYTEKEAWERTIRATVTEAAGKMGIRPTNLDYVAAYHQKEGHPHVHLVFWEKKPDRWRGLLSSYENREIKKLFIKEFYAEENARLNIQKTAVRDYIRNVAKDDLIKTVDFVRGIREAGLEVQAFNGKEPGIAPLFRDEKQKEMYTKLMGLADKLPGSGRIQLKYMPPEVKEEVRNIVDWILKQPGMIQHVDELKESAREMTLHYTKNPEALKDAEDKAYNDIRDRVSQVLLKAAVECQKDSIFTVNDEKAAKAVEVLKQVDKPLSFDKEKEQTAKTLIAALNEAKLDRMDISNGVFEFNRSSKAGMKLEQCNKLDDYIQNTKDISFNSLDRMKNASDYKKAKVMAASLKAIGQDKDEAVKVVRAVFNDKFKAFQEKIDKLTQDGYLEKTDKQYDMTDKLKQVIVKVKIPDKLEKSILTFTKDKPFTMNDLLKSKTVVKNAGELYSQQREFKFGKYDANVIFKHFKNNTLTTEQLRDKLFDRHTDETKAEEEYKNTLGRIEKLVQHGYVSKDPEEGAYSITREGLNAAKAARQAFEFTSFDANVVFKYIERADGSLNSQKLETILAEEYKDPEHAKKQLTYLMNRLDNNVEYGSVERTQEGDYKITDEGRKEAEAILQPYKAVIEKQINYLVELGLLEHDAEKGEYRISNKELLEETLQNRYLNLKDTPLDKDLYKLIDSNQGHINTGDIEKRNQEYINNIVKDFDNLKTDYASVRDELKVESTIDRVLGDMSKILAAAGLEREEALQIIDNWNDKSGMKIDKEVIEETLDKALNARTELKEWNRELIMGTDRWKELFQDLGVKTEDIPKWMYEGQFSQHATTFLNQAWKAVFRAIQKECAKSEAQAELLKKQDIRQHELENADHRRELVKKMKAQALFEEMELEQ